ncbi:MAG: ABC transporter ATP-binding protein [Roseburia sp.]
MIQAKQVVKTFSGFRALDGVNLHVPKGAVYGLVGPNGAGKSTIIRNITGIYKPDAGEITIDGIPVFNHIPAKEKFVYIPDDIFYFQQATILEMMHFYKGIYKNFDEQLFYRIRDAFPTVQLKDTIRRMSKGMQKQVAFWLGISCRPELMILDEPVDGLDPVMRRQIWNLLMSDVTENGTTIMVSSHNLRELEDVCNYVGIMHKGKVILEHSLKELQSGVCKMQVAYREKMPPLPQGLDLLHMSNLGRVYTLIVRGNQSEAKARLQETDPVLLDVLPLTLEEIFVYELGGEDYEVKDILF